MNKTPIGFFDSGIGGISIWNECNAILPYENSIYLADNKNNPYGKKSKNEIIQLCYKNVDYLLKKKCKLIVVACNTATTNAIDELRDKYDLPIIGIEPAIKPAALGTKTNSIGILATEGTITSRLFHETSLKWAKNIKVIKQIGHGLVPLIEEGKIDSIEMQNLLSRYIKPMINENVDHIVLGCTHYPFLKKQLRKILPSNVKVIDSGQAVARQVKTLINEYNLINDSMEIPTLRFYSNKTSRTLKPFIRKGKGHFITRKVNF